MNHENVRKNHCGGVFLVNPTTTSRSEAVCFYKKVMLAISLLALGACVSNPRPRDTEEPVPVVIDERIIIDGQVLPLPEEPVIETRPLPNQQPMSTVVTTLLRNAQTQRIDGNYDAAANSLERALRIEPRNAVLWSRLAGVRYAQKLWSQAVQMAAKSNTLAGTNRNLRRENWYLMANAYEANGNPASAQKYRDKLRRR